MPEQAFRSSSGASVLCWVSRRSQRFEASGVHTACFRSHVGAREQRCRRKRDSCRAVAEVIERRAVFLKSVKNLRLRPRSIRVP
jgi:hypothetical protein